MQELLLFGTSYLILEGESGYRFGYYHIETFPGTGKSSKVKAGDIVGSYIKDKRSTGPHLHFTVQTSKSRRSRFNPEEYFRQRNPNTPTAPSHQRYR